MFAPTNAIAPAARLQVTYEDVADLPTRGRSWRGTPYQLGDRVYAHGIGFNSTKHLRVTLDRPAERFTADLGLENNDDTARGATLGHGSVVFHVLVGEREVFTSKVLRLADGALPLDVPLRGATEFELRVSDAGDGRGWDQALWAEAVVTLADGSKVRLQDLPWAEDLSSNRFGVSFVYGGRPSAQLLRNWQQEVRDQEIDQDRSRRELTYVDPDSGLEVRLEADLYRDFPAVEWVVHLSNHGVSDTPLLEAIRAFDGALPVTSGAAPVLHWARGAVASFDDFAPMRSVLGPGAPLHLQPGGGRSSSQVLPFFNVEGAGSGLMVALGWSGEWASDFSCSKSGQPALGAGMAHTRLVLHPGEQIRTPRMLFLFYDGDRWRGQNQLRAFLLAHHRPLHNGKPMQPPITCGNWGGTRAEVHLDNIRQIAAHDLPLDYYWIDAEWFGRGTWPGNVGNWNVKPGLYPEGFRPLSDALRRSGRELMLWFEPERVYRGTAWHQQLQHWLLDNGGDNFLLDLGEPKARQYLTDFIAQKIDEFGLGCYRQDFNIDPLPFWQRADAPDRQGITEIRYIEGLYAFWDGLLARHPGLLIDNCASGGRRIDLETLGRATPFWRSDGPRDAIAHQCHTYGLMMWVPFCATSQDRAGDDYEFRSSMCSSLCLNWWVAGDIAGERIPADFPFAWAKQTLQQYRTLQPYFSGDYYPLSAYSQAGSAWQVYQLDLPAQGRGLVVALRRPDSPYEAARWPLHALVADATYRVTDLDSGRQSTVRGLDLQRQGLAVTLPTRPGSALLVYERMAAALR